MNGLLWFDCIGGLWVCFFWDIFLLWIIEVFICVDWFWYRCILLLLLNVDFVWFKFRIMIDLRIKLKFLLFIRYLLIIYDVCR